MKCLNTKAKNLFILDGLGALVSAFLLGIVLVQCEATFGIPRETLYLLAIVPCVFMVYDMICYFFVKENISRYLKIIACLNIAYCGLSLVLVFQHSEQVLLLGWMYIIAEILIILLLAKWEWNISNSTNPAAGPPAAGRHL